jgi:hypothetical protein
VKNLISPRTAAQVQGDPGTQLRAAVLAWAMRPVCQRLIYPAVLFGGKQTTGTVRVGHSGGTDPSLVIRCDRLTKPCQVRRTEHRALECNPIWLPGAP